MTHVNLYNAEGYFDPTVYAALTHIEQEAKRTAYKPLVFICSPYAGNIRRNTERAREYCRFAVSKNCIPISVNPCAGAVGPAAERSLASRIFCMRSGGY